MLTRQAESRAQRAGLKRAQGIDLFGWPAVACAVVLAAAIRIGSSRYSLWYDELASVFFAEQPFGRLWSTWMVRETNPPLYYSILHVWARLSGLGMMALRVPSIAVSLVAIVLTYVGMRVSFGARAAAVSAFLLALSGQQLFFGQEVRSYIFLYTAISLAFFGLVHVVRDREPRWLGWTCYCAGSLAAVYLHTTAFIWPAAASLALLCVDRRYIPLVGSRWTELVLADLLIGAGAGWWLYITFLQLRVPNENILWIARPSLLQAARLLGASILLSRAASGWLLVLPCGVALLATWGAVSTWRRSETRLTGACLLLAAALFIVLSFKQPILLDRTVFWLSVFPLVLASVGLAELKGLPFWVVGSLVVVLLGLNLVRLVPKLQAEDWVTPLSVLTGDPRAVLIVDSLSMNTAANTACLITIGRQPCPFPIVTMVRLGDGMDSWARDTAMGTGPGTSDRPALGNDVNAYLFRRSQHDPYLDLRFLGLSGLPTTVPFGASLVGPLPPPFLSDVERQGHWQGGLLILDKPVPLK